ncbi:MAG: Mur ligase family protein [Patescibacteria group bacterium]
MKLEELKNKKILILGFGIEGKSTMRFLKHHFPHKKIDIADQKNDKNYLKKQGKYDLVIKTPGISKRFVTAPHTTATNIFFANTKGTVIGVTGSKGKSTTASLVYQILKAGGYPIHLVGNIGNPALEELLKSNTTKDIYVYELSSYQLEDINYSPHISVIINLFPDHMDYHGGLKRYWNAKAKIISRAKNNDYFVYNSKYQELRGLAQKTKAKSIPIISTLPFSKSIIPLLGAHNEENVKIAITVSRLFNIPIAKIKTAIMNFKSLPHRLEFVGKYHNIRFYDDAISTTPESTIKAMESLPRISTILLGGKNRGYQFKDLAKAIVKHKIPNIVLFHETGEKIYDELKKLKIQMPNILKTKSMRDAVQFSYANSPKNSICLLSTASPSYILWKNFEEKGNEFQKFVRKLSK